MCQLTLSVGLNLLFAIRLDAYLWPHSPTVATFSIPPLRPMEALVAKTSFPAAMTPSTPSQRLQPSPVAIRVPSIPPVPKIKPLETDSVALIRHFMIERILPRLDGPMASAAYLVALYLAAYFATADTISVPFFQPVAMFRGLSPTTELQSAVSLSPCTHVASNRGLQIACMLLLIRSWAATRPSHHCQRCLSFLLLSQGRLFFFLLFFFLLS